MDKEDRDYWLINFSVTTASSEHSNYLYNSSVESIQITIIILAPVLIYNILNNNSKFEDSNVQ